MPDDLFLSLFHPDPDEAARLYGTLRQKLVFYFERKRCRDPEDLADEAIGRAIAAVRRGATITTTIGGFCYGIAKKVWLENLRAAPEDELADNLPVGPSRPPHQLSPTEAGILLREYLELLPPEDRTLLERYHLEDRRALAVELRKSENALRVEVCRVKRDLLQLIKQGRRPSTEELDPAE